MHRKSETELSLWCLGEGHAGTALPDLELKAITHLDLSEFQSGMMECISGCKRCNKDKSFSDKN